MYLGPANPWEHSKLGKGIADLDQKVREKQYKKHLQPFTQTNFVCVVGWVWNQKTANETPDPKNPFKDLLTATQNFVAMNSLPFLTWHN